MNSNTNNFYYGLISKEKKNVPKKTPMFNLLDIHINKCNYFDNSSLIIYDFYIFFLNK